MAEPAALVEVRSISKRFGSVNALQDVSLEVFPGQVTCVLGDNGAGQVDLDQDPFRGVFPPDTGELVIDETPVHFASLPAPCLLRHRDGFPGLLATVPLMSLWRNFFLG